MSHPFLVTILGFATLLALTFRRQRLEGTTLVAPWYWCVIAIWSIIAVELLPFLLSDQIWASGCRPLRYCAAITTLCPIVSLLGAKRPQHHAWQWIVLSLWVILAMPAATTLFFAHATFQIGILWSYFLLILVGMTVVNYLPTRYWPAGLLVGAAQCCLLADQLPGIRSLWASVSHHRTNEAIPEFFGSAMTALALLLAAAILVQWISRGRNALVRDNCEPLDLLWWDFRNCYGFLWGFRVADRFNGIAESQGHNIRLNANGFVSAGQETRGRPQETRQNVAEPMEQTFLGLLTRFVSTEWINKRKAEHSEKSGC